VFLARDTRESSPRLIAAMKRAFDIFGVHWEDFDLLTTPQLHWIVARTYETNIRKSVKDYVNHYGTSFDKFFNLVKDQDKANYKDSLILDCANGVGALAFAEIAEGMRAHLDVTLINKSTDQPTLLNEKCGAEYVHKSGENPEELAKV